MKKVEKLKDKMVAVGVGIREQYKDVNKVERLEEETGE